MIVMNTMENRDAIGGADPWYFVMPGSDIRRRFGIACLGGATQCTAVRAHMSI